MGVFATNNGIGSVDLGGSSVSDTPNNSMAEYVTTTDHITTTEYRVVYQGSTIVGPPYVTSVMTDAFVNLPDLGATPTSYTTVLSSTGMSLRTPSSTSTVWVSPSDPPGAIELLESFRFSDLSEIMLYLIREPELIALLNQSLVAARSAFGETVRLSLELSQTPDVPSGELYCMIQTALTAEQAMRALRAFDEQWWIDRVPLAAGKLNFDISVVNEHL
jgi:hypothetical protein